MKSTPFDRYLATIITIWNDACSKKLYKDPDKRREAYKRQLLFFNTQLTWGGESPRFNVSMEKEKSRQEYEK